MNEAFTPLSRSHAGRIALLRHKKHRDAQRLFVAEGAKCVADTLCRFELEALVATADWLAARCPAEIDRAKVFEASAADMERVSSLSTPPAVLAVYRRPDFRPDYEAVAEGLTLMLDGVQDPGNLGTIVRVADWFGFRQIFASRQCADIFGPKAVQATMGSITRVGVCYCDLEALLDRFPQLPVCGLLLDGRNIFGAELPHRGFIVMGSEGRGIGPALRRRVTEALLIPSWPPGEPTGESLNVGVATAITLAEFRRRMF